MILAYATLDDRAKLLGYAVKHFAKVSDTNYSSVCEKKCILPCTCYKFFLLLGKSAYALDSKLCRISKDQKLFSKIKSCLYSSHNII